MTKAVALISVLIIASLLSFLAIGFSYVMISENKIAKAHELAAQTHYLAEAGIQKGIWLTNYDLIWKDEFEAGTLNKTLELKNKLFLDGDIINITGASISPGLAWIEANAQYKDAKRKIKTQIYKAVGGSGGGGGGGGGSGASETRTVLSDQEVIIVFSNININNNSLHANTDLSLMFFSEVDIAENASAGNISIDMTSELNAQEIIEQAEQILMPGLDFDDYKSRADYVYTWEDFAILLEQSPVLSGIIYVTGSDSCILNIERNQNLTINGFLLTDCAIHIADQGDFGYTNLIINQNPNTPSGLASKNWIIFNPLTAQANITGLVYALQGIEIKGPIASFNVIGGIIAKKIFILNQLDQLNITYNQAIVNYALGQALDSPLIDLEHWEEEY